ncbi:Npun_R2821/Npun_R2822 family protein [Limnofasciculus baicalensis]|uniref:Sugar transferase n=1 Tax=Limnofasciculus baicalensis BBK-W-15 TaxID=2699891 RepID=A0AAE3GSS9_9CYAN|nr:Npun_R2821/Npun_R2822 family protein [Limnofasciculus baicalensis]MCP2729297.1 sugar transferase [Limnofasciculus baicalensis BBK-W-15]
MDGICTLASDQVYDQLVALLNSIEAIIGPETPVCVYPYNEDTSKIAAEIARRPHVQLYDNIESMERWDRFAKMAWDTHPTAKQRWLQAGSATYHRFGTHRRYCAFDGPFDRFLYMDADTLLMAPVDFIFAQLNESDCVVYDFQYKDPTHVYHVNSAQLNEVFAPPRIKAEIFCSGFYASKKDLFSEEQRNWLISTLKDGDADLLYPMAPDQTLINYMMMRSNFSVYNFALHLPSNQKTGCCVTSVNFQETDYILYDKGNRLTYIHYIGLSSKLFAKLCEGENINFPYRDLFLHYRYLHQPEKRPELTGKPIAYNQPPNLKTQILRKLGIN